ncbi:NADH dehydrogenase [ubiquinone] 1 alpha subcomplex assembly factor 2 [Bienertia sinuspersici]
MSKFLAKLTGLFSRRGMVGTDNVGNRYFARNVVVDGVSKSQPVGNLGLEKMKKSGFRIGVLILVTTNETQPTRAVGSLRGKKGDSSASVDPEEKSKEKRWVIFKKEEDPTSIPVEWICWLNGQRKQAPTPEEMAELEARREYVRQNVERLKKEEEQRKAIQGSALHAKLSGKVGGPDLQSYLRQVQGSEGNIQAPYIR